ncbi:MAG: hypothetical protein B7X58_12705 [Marinobacter sp. 34-60-7]|nr:MAG: hypothetical protein B7X58_12705 [Marinobacter sp. 34-60-7]
MKAVELRRIARRQAWRSYCVDTGMLVDQQYTAITARLQGGPAHRQTFHQLQQRTLFQYTIKQLSASLFQECTVSAITRAATPRLQPPESTARQQQANQNGRQQACLLLVKQPAGRGRYREPQYRQQPPRPTLRHGWRCHGVNQTR